MLPLIDYPDIVQHYAPYFEDLFTDEGYEHFQRYLSGLLVSENKTVQAINRLFCLDLKDQSSLNKFLNNSPFNDKELNTRRLDLLQSSTKTQFKPKGSVLGSLSIDDTLLEHYGKNMDGIYVIWDHNKHCYVRAHNLVTLHYSDDMCDYPVYDRLWEYADLEALEQVMDKEKIHLNAKKRAQKNTEQKAWRKYLLNRFSAKQYKHPVLRNVYKTKVHLAWEMLTEFYTTYPDIDLPVSFDSWFTCPELCKHIDQTLERAYVGAIKGDATLILAGSQHLKLSAYAEELRQEHLKTNKVFQKTTIKYKGNKEVYYTYCKSHRIKNYQNKQRLLITYDDKDLKGEKPRFYIGNQLKWHAPGMMRIYRHRWPIEVYHEEGKAEGLDKYQLRNHRAIKRHIALVVLVYSILQYAKHDATLLNKLQEKFSDIKAHFKGTLPYLRRITIAQSFHALIQWIFMQVQKGTSLEQVIQPLMNTIAYV